MLRGIDVSHHQKPEEIDWLAMRADEVRFAFIRSTYGVVPDRSFQLHMRKAAKAGIVVGAYHFLRYKSSQSAEAQAEAFLEAIQPVADMQSVMLPPVLDLEENRSDDQINTTADRRKYLQMVNTWLEMVEKQLGRTCIIYTRANFFNEAIGNVAGFGIRPLWVAHYTAKASPNIPKAWDRYTFWQFTESGRLGGYCANLDINRFDGDESDLQKLVAGKLSLPEPVKEDAEPPVGEPAVLPLGVQTRNLMCVNTTGLNIRSEPVASKRTWLATLPVGQTVEVLDSEDGWAKARTLFDGKELEGYVSAKHLRPRASDAVEALVVAAVDEWLRFKRGDGMEHTFPFYEFVGEMWQAIGHNLDGRDRDQPWSAASISWFVRKAGEPYDGFKFSAAHSRYINDAIVKRKAEKNAPFWGFRLDEEKPEIGDIVCQWRVREVDFDHAAEHSQFSSHTDVVVAKNSEFVTVIGGNVRQSVRTKKYRLEGNGKLVAEKRLFALMKNRLA